MVIGEWRKLLEFKKSYSLDGLSRMGVPKESIKLKINRLKLYNLKNRGKDFFLNEHKRRRRKITHWKEISAKDISDIQRLDG